MIRELDDDGRYSFTRIQLVGNANQETLGVEPLGSKRKFWLLIRGETQPWLFKFARPQTGEHWAEKLGSEIAKLIGLPAARAELGLVENEAGVLVESIVPHIWDEEQKQSLRRGDLIHGNEILTGYLADYDKTKFWGQSEHTYENITNALVDAVPEEHALGVLISFGGLLVLDALIGNTDRHHENWALLRTFHGEDYTIQLSPSYDHASSLGRELTNDARERILRENRIESYVRRGRGAIFGQSHGKHADNPLELVRWAAAQEPEWFTPWLERVRNLEENDILAPLEKMPRHVLDLVAHDFCAEFLRFTLNELKELQA